MDNVCLLVGLLIGILLACMYYKSYKQNNEYLAVNLNSSRSNRMGYRPDELATNLNSSKSNVY